MTEAYTDLDKTTRYYNFGSNVPFNFMFIKNINKDSKPEQYKEVIDQWLSRLPEGNSANWVVSIVNLILKVLNFANNTITNYY